MQSRLMDVNTSAIIYRREAIGALKTHNWAVFHGATGSMNGLLPESYRVIISDQLYNERMQQKVLAICPECKHENDFNTVKKHKKLLDYMQRVITGKNYIKVWECVNCHTVNRIKPDDVIETVLQKPYYLGVVPEPPKRTEGMQDRTMFHIKMEVWGWTLLEEIEQKIAKFRDDNWKKEETEGELNIDTSMEEASLV